MALSRDDIVAAAGFHFDTLASLNHFSRDVHHLFPSIVDLKDVAKTPLKRVAFVGTPCQINAIRRMEVLGVVPADAIKFRFGLFCAGNFQFGPEERQRLEEIGNFTWTEVYKVNLKEELLIHLNNREIRAIPLDRLDFMKRYACRFCDDYAAEFADLSFGGHRRPRGLDHGRRAFPPGTGALGQSQGSEYRVVHHAGKSPP